MIGIENLFSGPSLNQALYAHVEGVKNEVYKLSTDVLNSDDNEVPFNLLKEKLEVPLLDIHFERAETLKPREISKEYNVPTGRFGSVRKAMEIEIRVPFDGDPGLFKYTPSKYTRCLPRGGIDERNNELILIFHYWAREDGTTVKEEFERSKNQILDYQSWVNNDVQSTKDEIEQTIWRHLALRRKDLETASEVVLDLGIPERSNAQSIDSASEDCSTTEFSIRKMQLEASEDFKRCRINETEEHSFSPRQALVIQFLYEKKAFSELDAMSKDAILNYIEQKLGDAPTRVYDIFPCSKSSPRHPLYKRLLLFNRNRFWLNVEMKSQK